MKQTNFIERLVEDTLAAETAPDGQALTFQAQPHQQTSYAEEDKAEEYADDQSSQFSRLNESLDDHKSAVSMTTAADSVDIQKKKQQQQYEQSKQQADYIAMQKQKFDVDKLKEEKEREI